MEMEEEEGLRTYSDYKEKIIKGVTGVIDKHLLDRKKGEGVCKKVAGWISSEVSDTIKGILPEYFKIYVYAIVEENPHSSCGFCSNYFADMKDDGDYCLLRETDQLRCFTAIFVAKDF